MIIPVQGLLDLAKKSNPPEKEDYRKDGLLYCGCCHSKKECLVKFNGVETLVSCSCDCSMEKWQKKEEEFQRQQKDMRVRQLKNIGITDSRYYSYHFGADDEKLPQISRMCHNFVDNFEEIRKNRGGLLLYGNVGTGKTFYACCIANALMEQGFPVIVTNFARILQQMQDFEEKKQVIPKLCRQSLVVIDDLGSERDTSYGKEQVFSVVDSLLRAEVCTIITTNLSPLDMEERKNLEDRRIYDRVLGGLCPEKVLISGISRRVAESSHRQKNIKGILWK